jgi:hypothetical protein
LPPTKINKEKRLSIMKRVIYTIGNMETTSYELAREKQPTGRLNVRYEETKTIISVKPETLAKRQEYFRKLRGKREV